MTKYKTVREWIDGELKGKPLDARGVEGISIYKTKAKTFEEWLDATDKECVGVEIFELTNKTFITDPKMLEYVGKKNYTVDFEKDEEGNFRDVYKLKKGAKCLFSAY